MRAWPQRAFERAHSALARAMSRLPRRLATGCGAVVAGLAVVFVLAAGGVTAHSSVTGGARALPAGQAGPVPRPAGPGGPGAGSASPDVSLAGAYSGIV